MWALTPEGHSEPASGILVQGKQSYWSEALGQFEKIVKQNMGQLRFTSGLATNFILHVDSL